jgi:hypothetical protein
LVLNYIADVKWGCRKLAPNDILDIDPVKSPLRQLDEERLSRKRTADNLTLQLIAGAHTPPS